MREVAAVEEWFLSDLDFHSLRDHGNHFYPYQGGMWGLKRSGLVKLTFNITEKLKSYVNTKQHEKFSDQLALRDILYPAAKNFT